MAATLQVDEIVDYAVSHLERLGLSALISSNSVSRLSDIYFMGLLGRTGNLEEQSRLHHSLAVALLAARVLEGIGAPGIVVRHAASAALLHDASQWALSHSCEGAFARLTGSNNGKIVQAMIYNKPLLPRKYHIGDLLRDLSLDPELIWAILSRDVGKIGEGAYWRAAVELFSCQLNPDTIDGISRACKIFNLSCPRREDVADCFFFCSDRLSVKHKDISLLDSFWESKAAVYTSKIHCTSNILLEIQYSLAVYRTFRDISLGAALELTDREVLDRVKPNLRDLDSKSIASGYKLRFRRPRRYLIDRSVLEGDLVINVLDLGKRYKSITIYGPRERKFQARDHSWQGIL